MICTRLLEAVRDAAAIDSYVRRRCLEQQANRRTEPGDVSCAGEVNQPWPPSAETVEARAGESLRSEL